MFYSPKLSLMDILGEDYLKSVLDSCEYFGASDPEALKIAAEEKVDFYPLWQQEKNDELLKEIGKTVARATRQNNPGAPTDSFRKAFNMASSPVNGFGNMRIGEDGKLYFIGKSEHYHASLGHNFNGYRLIANARTLGILNATHNNTRGYITRLLEKELVAAAGGKIDRVINLETGSIACEAGIKMMLNRFYQLDQTFDVPKYSGKIPVFLVMADHNGGSEANYHGTTLMAQTFRGMWPEFYQKVEEAKLYRVVAVEKNDIEDFEKKIRHYNEGDYKTAGFIHEIVLMNYGGILLKKNYMQEAYRLCRAYDTPVMVDEIQSCMWYKGMFLYKHYDLEPNFVVIGKGFSGGQYAASKIMMTKEMDTLNQFGALVTNGQEELASLSYLITMIFAKANEEKIQELGNYFEDALDQVRGVVPHKIKKIEGKGHCAAIHFNNVTDTIAFTNALSRSCIDIGAQVYKANCPPAALLKPALVASKATLDFLTDRLRETALSL